VYDVQVTVTDSGGLTDVQNIAVTVTDGNDPPTITSDGGGPTAAVNAAENQTAVTDVQSTDPEGDTEGAGLTYSITGGADQALFSIVAATGVLTFNSAPDFENPGDSDANNTYLVQVTVADSSALTDVQDITVSVTNVNEPPTITAIADQTTNEDTATGALAFTIGDPETPAAALIVTATSSNQTLIPDANLTLGGAGTARTIDVTPALNQSGGPATITVNVDDGTTATPETFGVTVIAVADPPVAVDDSYTTVGNVELVAGGATPTSMARVVAADGVLTAGTDDSDPIEGGAISVIGINGTMSLTGSSTLGGDVTMNANGFFVYVPPVGVKNQTGGSADTFTYTLQNTAGGQDTATVSIEIIDEMVWFVHNDPAGEPLNPAPDDANSGRSNDPFDTLVQADGTVSMTSGIGDTIFVYEGDSTTAGQDAGIELLSDQILRGHQATALVLGNVTIQTPGPGLRPKIGNTSMGHGVTVLDRTGVEIWYLDIAGDMDAINATSSGTNNLEVVIDNNVISGAVNEGIQIAHASSGLATATVQNNTIAATGNAFDATTTGAGDLQVAFNNNGGLTSSSGGGAGVRIEDVVGTGSLFVTSFSNNTVLGSSNGDGVRVLSAVFDADPADPDFDLVAGGDLTVGQVADRVGGAGVILGSPASRVQGNLGFGTFNAFSNSGAALSASGTGVAVGGPSPTSGFLLAIAGGTADAIGGPAVAFDPMTSNVSLTNISSSGSGTAGVSLNAVAGSFGAGTGGIFTSTGPGFEIIGCTVSTTYGGGITQSTNAPAVSVSGGHSSGTVSFNTGAISATAGTGLQFNNADGIYNFNGTTTLNGGDAGIDIVNGSDGAFTFGAATSITNPTGMAFNLNGGSGAVTYSGSIANSADRTVNIQGRTGGTVTLQTGAITDTGGTGVQVVANTASTTSFNGTVDITSSTSGAVTVSTNTGGSTSFADLDINNVASNQAGLTAAANGGSHTLNITTGTITTGAGRAVDVDNTVLGINLTTVSVNGAATGIDLNTTTGTFTVTGDGVTQSLVLPDGTSETVLVRNGTGGTLQSTTGDAVVLVNAQNVTLRQMNINTPGQDGVDSTGGTNITLSAVDIDTPANNGWIATNLAGTSRFDNNGRITGINAANESAIHIANTNTNNTAFVIENSLFNNSNSGQSTVLFEAMGISNVNLDVFGSTFENLFSQAVTATPGQTAGSTGTMRTRVGGPVAGDGNQFINASVAGNGGENNVGCVLANGATHNCLIQANLFDNITKDGSIANTSVIRTQNTGGTFNGEIRSNTIRSINIQTPTGRHGIGHVNEPPAAYPGTATTSLIIDGNTIDDLPEREAIFIDFRAEATGGNISITNNTIGQATCPGGPRCGDIGGGQEGIEIRTRGLAKIVNVLFDGNQITGNMTTTSTTRGIVSVDSEDASTVNLNLSNNTITDLGINREIEIDSEDDTPASTMCASVFSNTLDSGAGQIEVDEDPGAVLDLVQTSQANLASVNGIPTGNVIVTGAPNWNGTASCTMPTHPSGLF
jgi:hypothetical protein